MPHIDQILLRQAYLYQIEHRGIELDNSTLINEGGVSNFRLTCTQHIMWLIDQDVQFDISWN